MFALERIKIIKRYLIENNQAEVSNLSESLGVSEVTIRRDLEKLENEGFLTRTHGGAIINSSYERFVPKEFLTLLEKKSIMDVSIGDSTSLKMSVLFSDMRDFTSLSENMSPKENFDFLKLNYSEFFGDNGTQWSWYNVPQSVREEFWPGKPRLPQIGLDPNAPKTQFNAVLSHKGVPYAVGEVYYCNWPQIVSRIGNKKMFLDTTWAHPFEQTWMSHMYQLVKKDELYPGLLLMTPTEHDRFEHYNRELRKES